MLFRLVLLAVVAMASLMSASCQKPNCETSCGNVSIPFPFGLEKDCSYNFNFLVTCNQSTGIPYFGSGKYAPAIKSISTNNGEMEMMMYVANDCYDRSGDRVKRNNPRLWLSDFRISAKNVFVAIGCDTHAYINGTRGDATIGNGCITRCGSNNIFKNESCSGVGCCEIAIPKELSSFNMIIGSYTNHTNMTDFNSCSYAFVVEKGKYNFSSNHLHNFSSTEMPMLLDWAVGNLSCSTVNQEAEDFLCKGNSICDTSYEGLGYRCRCKEGYQGNPYIVGNCINIDECQDNSHECDTNTKCKDTEGDYKCLCQNGYSGDSRHGGCTKDVSAIIEMAVGISVSGIFLLILVSWSYLGLKKRKLLILREKFFKQNGGIMLQQRISGDTGSQDQAKVFTVEELEKATDNYDESKIIGKGGYGTVFRGVLSDNRIVAIKKSKLADQTQSQIEQFINEVVILSQINHRNVVKLIGCCLETEVPLLVYEFISNGTLSDHLHDETKSLDITWDIRLRIATETAGALSYLHFAASVPIIHRDVKPMNILLDDSYVAKVADFGASRLIPMDQNEVATMVQGTLGYLDPEYLHTSQLTEKSDVYSFGVVLVELLTGKMILNFDKPQNERNMTKYFLSCLEDEKLLQVLDEHLQLKEVPHEIIQVSRLAQRCLHLKGEERPTMKEVALELEGIRASMIDNHPWVKSISDEEETEYLLKEPKEDFESTDKTNINAITFYSIIRNPTMASGR